MKKITANTAPPTEDKLKKILKDYPTKKDLKRALSNYPTKKETKAIVENALENHPTKWEMDKKFDDHDSKWDERFTQLKSDIFTRFDEMMGELAQIRKNGIFFDRDVKVLGDRVENHEDRLKKLETS